MRSFYDLLGISERADEQEIKRAYQKALLACHPDKSNGKSTDFDVDTCKRAFQILRENRDVYDQWLREQRLRETAVNLIIQDIIQITEIDETETVDCRCGGIFDVSAALQSITDSALVACDTCSLFLKIVISENVSR